MKCASNPIPYCLLPHYAESVRVISSCRLSAVQQDGRGDGWVPSGTGDRNMQSLPCYAHIHFMIIFCQLRGLMDAPFFNG